MAEALAPPPFADAERGVWLDDGVATRAARPSPPPTPPVGLGVPGERMPASGDARHRATPLPVVADVNLKCLARARSRKQNKRSKILDADENRGPTFWPACCREPSCTPHTRALVTHCHQAGWRSCFQAPSPWRAGCSEGWLRGGRCSPLRDEPSRPSTAPTTVIILLAWKCV
jgi:hypothetical protein